MPVVLKFFGLYWFLFPKHNNHRKVWWPPLQKLKNNKWNCLAAYPCNNDFANWLRQLKVELCLLSCIFILLSREEAPEVLICSRMSSHPFRMFTVPRFRVLFEILSILLCCLFVFHKAVISIFKHRIQRRFYVTRTRVEAETLIATFETLEATNETSTVHAIFASISILLCSAMACWLVPPE